MAFDDDSIRRLLAGIPSQPFIWVPKGNVAIMSDKVVEAGGDLDAVHAWVLSVGGDEDRTLPVVSTRRGTTAVPKPVGRRYFIVPTAALAPGDEAA